MHGKLGMPRQDANPEVVFKAGNDQLFTGKGVALCGRSGAYATGVRYGDDWLLWRLSGWLLIAQKHQNSH
jgi:hypothetical protein